MPENKFDSGHAVLPIKTVDGDVHNVAIPIDTTLESLHDSLSSDPTYLHTDFPTPQPDKNGVLELSPKFRQAALSAMIKTNAQSLQNSGVGLEAGFTVGNNGEPSAVTTMKDESDESRGHMRQYVGPNDFAAVHSHDLRHADTPSEQDRDAARTSGKRIFITSRSGLYEINAQGGVTRVFSSPSWMTDKSPK
jgi:hypothetical protein